MHRTFDCAVSCTNDMLPRNRHQISSKLATQTAKEASRVYQGMRVMEWALVKSWNFARSAEMTWRISVSTRERLE